MRRPALLCVPMRHARRVDCGGRVGRLCGPVAPVVRFVPAVAGALVRGPCASCGGSACESVRFSRSANVNLSHSVWLRPRLWACGAGPTRRFQKNIMNSPNWSGVRRVARSVSVDVSSRNRARSPGRESGVGGGRGREPTAHAHGADTPRSRAAAREGGAGLRAVANHGANTGRWTTAGFPARSREIGRCETVTFGVIQQRPRSHRTRTACFGARAGSSAGHKNNPHSTPNVNG